jgi:hypothetical protein
VLVPGGHYVAQHVGPASAFELIEFFLGPLPHARQGRDPRRECAAAERAGLVVEDLRTARCRMEFHDVGAMVWILRKCVWWVPGFTVAGYEGKLRRLDAQVCDGRVVEGPDCVPWPGVRAREPPEGSRSPPDTVPGVAMTPPHAVCRCDPGHRTSLGV